MVSFYHQLDHQLGLATSHLRGSFDRGTAYIRLAGSHVYEKNFLDY